MNIDDFMKNAEAYNTDSDTITGFFNLDEDDMENKGKQAFESLKTAERKSDVLLMIDAITDSKIEGIVLTSALFEKIGKMDGDDDVNAMRIAMAVAISCSKDLIDESKAEDVLRVFASVFADM